jgi:hypothetical protein
MDKTIEVDGLIAAVRRAQGRARYGPAADDQGQPGEASPGGG